jgi:hypothetical protein
MRVYLCDLICEGSVLVINLINLLLVKSLRGFFGTFTIVDFLIFYKIRFVPWGGCLACLASQYRVTTLDAVLTL